MAKKLSPLSFAARLTPEQREELYALLQGKTLAEGVAWCAERGVKTSDSSLSEWLPRYRMIRRVEGYDERAKELEASLARRGVDPLLVPKLAQQVFLLQAAEAEDADTFATMGKLIQRHVEFEAGVKGHADRMAVANKQLEQKDKAIAQKDQEIEMQRRKIEAQEALLEEARQAAARAKETLKSGGMDDATREALMEEVDAIMLGKPRPKESKPVEG